MARLEWPGLPSHLSGPRPWRFDHVGWGSQTDPLSTRTCAASGTSAPDGGPVDRLGVEWRGTRPQQIMALRPGTRLGHYNVTALIHTGGWS